MDNSGFACFKVPRAFKCTNLNSGQWCNLKRSTNSVNAILGRKGNLNVHSFVGGVIKLQNGIGQKPIANFRPHGWLVSATGKKDGDNGDCQQHGVTFHRTLCSFLLPWCFVWIPDSNAKAKRKRLPPVSRPWLRGKAIAETHEGRRAGRVPALCRQRIFPRIQGGDACS